MSDDGCAVASALSTLFLQDLTLCAACACVMHLTQSTVGAPVIFADPGKYAGKTIPVVRERLSWPDAAQILTEVTGIPVKCAC